MNTVQNNEYRLDTNTAKNLPSTLSPEHSSSPPDLNPGSDALEVPISSSPGVSSPLVSSPCSVVSVECGYSASATDSSETTGSRTPKIAVVARGQTEFAEQLTDRLLFAARSESPLGVENSAAPSRDRTPRAFRIVKRSYSLSLSPEPSAYSSKSRKVGHHYDACEIPTEPSTPIPSRRWCAEVPAIAPPVSYVPRLPLSAETEAKIRLGKFLDREGKERTRDGFLEAPQFGIQDPDQEAAVFLSSLKKTALLKNPHNWERRLAIGKDLRERVINWLTGVLPKHASGRYTSSKSESSSASSANSSFSSTSSTTSCEISNLYDQLATCPETRFHAVWMFLRYFWLVSLQDSASKSEVGSREGSPSTLPTKDEADEDFELPIWDTAIACLAISVKATQRDVLKALSYSVGVSPQAILDELWAALPSLREVMSFDGGWNALQKEVWFRLYDILDAPDILRFPQSHLVAISLVDSLIPCLATRYEYQATWHAKTARRIARTRNFLDNKERFTKRATEDAEGIIFDVQAAVGISDGQLIECRTWWAETLARLRLDADKV